MKLSDWQNFSKNQKLMRIVILIAWTALHVYLSATRSLWQDELMRFRQMQMGFGEAMISLFSEQSPFAPGEILLGFISKVLLSSFTSFELWSRLPSVLWGTLTLWLALRVKSPLFMILLVLSVSMTSFTTQFRPYGALIFAGAYSFWLIIDKKPLSRFENILAWLTIFMTHVYGIGFMALAFAFRRDWLKTVIALVYGVSIGAIYMSFHEGQVHGWVGREAARINPEQFVQHTLRALGNPYRVSFFLLPFALAGAFHIARTSFKLGTQVACHFFVVLIAPLIANKLGHYEYVPRQIVGGIFGYLFLATLGVENFIEFLKKVKINVPRIRIALFVLFTVISARAWFLYVIDGRPPLSEQPLHKHKQNVELSIKANDRNVVLLDPGGTGFFYFDQLKGPAQSVENIKIGDLTFIKRCWSDQYCVYHFDEAAYAWRDLNELAEMPSIVDFLNGDNPKIDRLFFNQYTFKPVAAMPMHRTW